MLRTPRALLAASLVLVGCSAGPDSVAVTETSVVVSTSTTTSTAITTSTTVTTVTEVTTASLAAPDPGTPGPVGGPTCPVAPAYYNEPGDGLSPNTRAAWDQAVAAAVAAGVTLCLHDGKRSTVQQQDTYDSYVAQHGHATADSLVLPPEKSAHVLGYAIDVQPVSSAAWLEETNGRFGLCRMYDNEPWHFEYAQSFVLGCPPRRAAP